MGSDNAVVRKVCTSASKMKFPGTSGSETQQATFKLCRSCMGTVSKHLDYLVQVTVPWLGLVRHRPMAGAVVRACARCIYKAHLAG